MVKVKVKTHQGKSGQNPYLPVPVVSVVVGGSETTGNSTSSFFSTNHLDSPPTRVYHGPNRVGAVKGRDQLGPVETTSKKGDQFQVHICPYATSITPRTSLVTLFHLQCFYVQCF